MVYFVVVIVGSEEFLVFGWEGLKFFEVVEVVVLLLILGCEILLVYEGGIVNVKFVCV